MCYLVQNIGRVTILTSETIGEIFDCRILHLVQTYLFREGRAQSKTHLGPPQGLYLIIVYGQTDSVDTQTDRQSRQTNYRKDKK